MRLAYALCIMVLFFFVHGAANAQTVLNANDRGWYNSAGRHGPQNKNTLTGQYSSNTYNSFFKFQIPAGISCVGSATLELELERYYGDGAPHLMQVHDVDPSHVALLSTTDGSGAGVAIHSDLQSGALYGSLAGTTGAQTGQLLTLNLSAQALIDIAAASGGDFAVGVHVIPSGTGSLRALRYSASTESRVHRLTLTGCTGAPDIVVNKASALAGSSGSDSFAVPGSDITYTIDIANVGTASPDADSLFLVDKLPPQTVFFNGDFDGSGPGTGPIAVTNSGSGLTFNQSSDVAFSNGSSPPGSFAACTYTPTSGYDPNVKFICLNPKGVLATGSGPTFSISFRGRID